MKAGRELDALRVRVAVEVFGWKETDKRLPDHDPNWLAYESPWYETPDGSILHYTHIPDYPRNMADAWLVVEKLREESIALVISTYGAREYTSCYSLYRGACSETTFADGVPLAICLAALKAVENK